ncbi:4-alpha-glucanotransferase [Gemmatimonadota bacterium]
MDDAMSRELRMLARLYGLQTSYQDVFGASRSTPVDAVLDILRQLGAPVQGIGDVPGALRERRETLTRHFCEPVVVARAGESTEVRLRVPESLAGRTLRAELTLESGERREWETPCASFLLPDDLPVGYHQLDLEAGTMTARSQVLSAPVSAPALSARGRGREWGAFLPLYALHTEKSLGVGDLGDLAALMDWVSDLGGSFIGILPILTTFCTTGGTPSPYAPASRLFWNECYLHFASIPEFGTSPEAADLLESSVFSEAVSRSRSSGYVDFREVAPLRRRVLEILSNRFFAEGTDTGTGDSLPDESRPGDARRASFERFRSHYPLAEEYARFMAARERFGSPWQQWPDRQRSGDLRADDHADEVFRYHLYVQWLMAGQLDDLAARGRTGGIDLYLDYPVGVPQDSFDVWRFRDLFLSGSSVGAPPDTFFRKGQRWGFPPADPQQERRQGYEYFIAGIRNHLRFAGMLRIDHIMGLHRTYVIPDGFDATAGAYLRSNATERYAILRIEAHRTGAALIGEDLGTVPRSVRVSMKQEGIGRMFVLQSELRSDPDASVAPVTSDALASLGTHDMPLFAAFWRDEDTALLQQLGHLDQGDAGEIDSERGDRRNALLVYLMKEGLLEEGTPDLETIIPACHALLATGCAPAMMVTLEDLWLETRPQNVPGTTDEQPNWSRRSALSLEEMMRSGTVVEALETIDRLRDGPPRSEPRERPA